MVAIGIDPGVNTGFVVWDCEGQKFIELLTLDFWTAFDRMILWKRRCEEAGRRLALVIENPNLNKPVFPRGNKLPVKLSIAQRVGMNKKEADLLIKAAERMGIYVRTIKPTKQKWNADTFRRVTGYEGRTNEHKRDAGRLVFGMRSIPDSE